MLTVQEVNDGWARVVEVYDKTRDGKPSDTMKQIISEFGYGKAREIFATIAKIKQHDGRIYGANREFMNETPTNPEIGYMSRIGHLDDIHPAHINQLIGELRKER